MRMFPPPRPIEPMREPAPGAIVVTLDSQFQIEINQQPIALSALGPRLEEIFKSRNERAVFVKGSPDVNFGDVANIIDSRKAPEPIGLG